MNDEQITDLFKRFQAGTCSQQEVAQVYYWMHKFRENEASGLSRLNLEFASDQMWKSILKSTQQSKARIIKWPMRAAISAASIVLVFGASIYFFTKNPSYTKYANDVDPGTNKAVLILNDGKRIDLSGAKNGLLALQSTTKITKTEEGKIVYTSRHELPPSNNGGKSSYSGTETLNTIQTPRGGQYKLSLPDGTKVWLNAASSLTYPISFGWFKERRIELSGEAYFEVAKDAVHPFIVQSKTQLVKVYGTRFDISTYPNESNTVTTLQEGSVQVTTRGSDGNSKNVMLKPGQEAVHSASGIKVSQVDADLAIAWKNGDFSFRNEPLEDIMKEISRWYDVDIVYQNKKIGQQVFGGTISRYGKVSEVLKMLELTGDVKFKIEGKTITVL